MTEQRERHPERESSAQGDLDPIACFLTACEIERREHRATRRERKVVHGRRLAAERGRFLYSFDLKGVSDLKEDSSVQLVVGDAFYHATVHSFGGRTVTLALTSDLGAAIDSARIETQEQDLLQALILRLKELRDSGSVSRWNGDLARRVLRLEPPALGELSVASVKPPEDLTEDQRLALIRCMSQPVTYVWGPPGTGKTVLMAALALQLYQENKRVLIVSHTNHAVDGVVECICKRITERGRTSVAEGSILRVGTMVKESLIERYAEQVSLDAVINKSHDKVTNRLHILSCELREVRDELFSISRKLALLDTHQQLREEIERVRNSDGMADRSFVAAIQRTLDDQPQADTGKQFDDDLFGFMEDSLRKVSTELHGCDRDTLNDCSVELSSRQLELAEAVAVLEKFTRDLRSSLLERARIVATSATYAMLATRDLDEFDVVLIDEASMLPLPLCFLLSGRARERVVIAGDFRQLPAIARSDSPMVQQWYSRDVFDCAGVIDLVDERREHPAVATLTTQFRSHETLCSLINNRFYGGALRTKTDSAAERYIYRDPLAYLNRSPLVLVDTSELAPLGEVQSGSKLNLLHALIVRKLALLLSAHGIALLPEALGVIVPYRAQADLIRSLIDECSLGDVLSVGTVHKFQGSERDAIILDLTESAPHMVGGFLNPHSLRATGARLLNVALSRAKRHLIVVANVAHLRAQLSMRSLMWGILDDLERVGYRLSAADVIGEQIFTTPSREVRQAPGILAFQSFDEALFMPALVTDLIDAQGEVIISSSRISARVATVMTSVLERPMARGVRVLVRYSAAEMSQHEQHAILQRLRRSGVVLVPVTDSVPSAVVVDSEIVWIGSLIPLDSLGGGRGVMVRAVSAEAAQRMIHTLEFDSQSTKLKQVAL